MNAKVSSVARFGLIGCGVLALAATGCRINHVHTHPRRVYVPPVVVVPPAPQPPPPVVVTPPPPAPQPPVVVAPSPVPAPQPPPPIVAAPAPVVVIEAASDFYEPLGVYGRWVIVGSHGRCWVPARVEMGWRPYCNGYWQRTDAGWYWMSDEPWGWATYHYGRWDWREDYGWFWVPHTQWAPAWVCWREGGGYVGWAPLRPSVGIGVSIGMFDYEPVFARRAFVFVEHRHMLEPVRHRTVIVNNTTIINKTVNITKVVNKTVINEGPRPDVIERESGRKVQTIPAREFRHREETTVATRERGIPTAGRKAQPPVRLEAQPAPTPAPREVRAPERTPAIAKPTEVAPQPTPPTARPTPPPPAVTRPGSPPVVARPQAPPAQPPAKLPARVEQKPEAAGPKQVAPPVAAPAPKPEPRTIPTARPVAPQPQPTPAMKPAATPNPVRQPARPPAPRNETRPAPAVEKRDAAVPRLVEPKAKGEIQPGSSREVKPPVKTEAASPAAPARPTAPPAQAQPQKPLVSPKETTRAAERGVANKKMNEAKDANVTDGREPETRAGRPTRQPR